jgi:hypothetical protein
VLKNEKDRKMVREDTNHGEGVSYVEIIYGQNLNAASKGVWQKVYEAGYLNGAKVEVYYFYNSTTGQYGNPYILTGKWASKAFKGLK